MAVELSPASVTARRRWTVAVASLSAALMTLDVTIVNVALPQIEGGLGAGLDGLQWIVNAYTLAFAALLLSVGSLSDRVGRRRIFALGVAVFTGASLGCALAPGTATLVVARTVQGVGGALVMGTGLALIAAAYAGTEARARNTAIGLFAAGGAAAAALGPLVGGLVVDAWGWRYIFVLNLPLGLAILLATWLRLTESKAENGRHRLDLAGLVLAAAMLFGLNYALLTGPLDGWSSTPVVAALVAAGALTAAFLFVQWRRGEAAMLDLRLFRIRSFTGAILVTYAARLVSFGLLPFLVLWLSGMLGYGPFQIGLRLLLLSITMIVVAPLSGALTRRVPVHVLMALGMALTGAGALAMTTIEPGDGWTAAAPGLLLLGAGAGLAAPHLLGVAVGVVPPERAGMASGAANTFFPLGTASGVALYGAVLAHQVDRHLTDAGSALEPAAAERVRALVTSGRFDALAALPGPVRQAAEAGFTSGLSAMLTIAGVAALLAALASLLLIRGADQHQASG
ncbi:MFS transporter [Phytohabitans sp. ZYX-F-186]|uniref:MFS transporter n=1 Tax=Phytohabitans maris TaxID=3071409 RepID=A0ABU0ZS75_9ACTN|nr:MFS transporter [Phytohabitans sp. ZYX-F-186]MDQ7909888.1 MFS transporter [Phytohabitans sp. ZYX-F-186]